jgi:two-component system, NarL family, response regulator NreC
MNNFQYTKIFIADDHPVVTQGISFLLSKQPEFEVVGTAASGDEMTQFLRECRPNVLLLDLNMPGKDFFENIAWVKKHTPWVKVLAYSAYYTPELVRSLIHEGARGFVPKTAAPNELIEAIQTVQTGEIYISPVAHAQSDNCPDPGVHPELQDDFRKRLGLSRREQEVLVLISEGLSSQRIGQTLYISKHTVETHRKNILRKLDFNSSTELVKFAVQHGLV